MQDLKNIPIACPHCNRPSNSIKQCRFLGILFLFLFMVRQTRTVNACQSCMRGKILEHALINILTANILWPFIILPMSIYQFIRIRQPGHDDAILSEITAALYYRQIHPARGGSYGKLGKL
jgi:hypothetical protein